MSTPIAYIVIDESNPRLIAGQYQFDRICSGALIIPSGSSFPGDPFSGEIFWRTDEVKLYRRDDSNTNWEASTGDGGGGSDTPETEIIASQIINGIDANLTATLTYEPTSTGSVSIYINSAYQIQNNPSGSYILTGSTNQTIHWLASSSLSAFDLDETDCIVVKYLR